MPGVEGSYYGGGRYIGNENNPYLVFVGIVDRNASSVEIHPNTRIIAEYALANCQSLTSITVPNGVVAIDRSAFSGSSYFKSVYLPATLKYLMTGAFSGTTASLVIYCPLPSMPENGWSTSWHKDAEIVWGYNG